MEGPPNSMEVSYGAPDENRGMIPRTVEQVFNSATALESKGWKFSIEAHFLEVSFTLQMYARSRFAACTQHNFIDIE